MLSALMYAASCATSVALLTTRQQRCLKHVLDMRKLDHNCPPFVAMHYPDRLEIFMQVPKAAHTTVQETASKQCAAHGKCTPYVMPLISRWNARQPHALCIDEFKAELGLAHGFRTHIFAYVRNPVERTISGIMETAVVRYGSRGNKPATITPAHVERVLQLAVESAKKGGDRHIVPQSFFAYPTTRDGKLLPVDLRDMYALIRGGETHIYNARKMASKASMINSSSLIRPERKCVLASAFKLDYSCLGTLYNISRDTERCTPADLRHAERMQASASGS